MLLTLATGCGGNACNANPSADAIHGLILNDAMAVIASAEGVREIPILELFAGPGKNTLKQGELLLRFEVPKPAPHTGAAYTKFAIRGDSDIAIVGTGALLTLSDDGTVAKTRVSLGAVAPTPIRAAKTEALIAGKKLTDELRNSICSRSVHTMLSTPHSMQQKNGCDRTLADRTRAKRNTTKNATV